VGYIPITIRECREIITSRDMRVYYISRATLCSVALVSRVFASPAMDALWSVLLDAGPLTQLLKAHEQVSCTRVHELKQIG
jgi:hypothetical protein